MTANGRRDANALRDLQRLLRTALVADALDTIGLREQSLAPGLSPLRRGTRLVGHAFPVEIVTVDAVPDRPYERLLRSLDAVSEGDVYVAAVRGASRVAIWGELLTTACQAGGAFGAVCDGYARDSDIIRELGFPVFCRGTAPTDSKGRSEVLRFGSEVAIDGVEIARGDMIVADDDGVVVVPQQVADEVVRLAVEKDRQETEFRRAVRDGMSARTAFETFGVL